MKRKAVVAAAKGTKQPHRKGGGAIRSKKRKTATNAPSAPKAATTMPLANTAPRRVTKQTKKTGEMKEKMEQLQRDVEVTEEDAAFFNDHAGFTGSLVALHPQNLWKKGSKQQAAQKQKRKEIDTDIEEKGGIDLEQPSDASTPHANEVSSDEDDGILLDSSDSDEEGAEGSSGSSSVATLSDHSDSEDDMSEDESIGGTIDQEEIGGDPNADQAIDPNEMDLEEDDIESADESELASIHESDIDSSDGEDDEEDDSGVADVDYESMGARRHWSNVELAKEGQKLPIRDEQGNWVKRTGDPSRRRQEEEEENDDDDDLPSKPKADAHHDEQDAYVAMDMMTLKTTLAQLGSSVVEDPDNKIGNLKKLRHLYDTMCVKPSHDSGTASLADLALEGRRLVLLTEMAVYRDIVPGYRIRDLREEEGNAPTRGASKLSKDVRQRQRFEQSLLRGYHAFLKTLSSIVRKKQKGKKQGSLALDKHQRRLVFSAYQAMVLLLETTNTAAFNFSDFVVEHVVEGMNHKNEKIAQRCHAAMKQMFSNDASGEMSHNSVQYISKFIKKHSYRVSSEMIDVLSFLRLREEFKTVETQAKGNASGKKGKKDKDHVSRSQKKRLKEEKKFEREMKEAEGVVSQQEKYHWYKETLSTIFVIYIRILKSSFPATANAKPSSMNTYRRNPLLPAVLDGLGKFSHLIHIHMFYDLLAWLKRLTQHLDASTTTKPTDKHVNGKLKKAPTAGHMCIDDLTMTLRVIKTVFQLLPSQLLDASGGTISMTPQAGGTGVDVDLKHFYTVIYTILQRLMQNLGRKGFLTTTMPPTSTATAKGRPEAMSALKELMVDCLDELFFKQHRRRVTTSKDRMGAFLVRFVALMKALLRQAWSTKETSSTMGPVYRDFALRVGTIVLQLFTKRQDVRILLNPETLYAHGVYQPMVNDPDLAFALCSKQLWQDVCYLEKEASTRSDAEVAGLCNRLMSLAPSEE